jgi:hypothetical protein
MEQYYSKVEKDKLIFSWLKGDELCDRRIDLSPDDEIMQVCGRSLSKDVVVPPHKHLDTIRETKLTQEAWVVLKGKVKARFYDLDDSFLCERYLSSGDVVTFYRGGHSLTVLEEGTLFYEFKNGPYYGIQKDKEKIDE